MKTWSIFLLLLTGLTFTMAGYAHGKKGREKPMSVFSADINYGMIGAKDASHTDDAFDNIFHVRLSGFPAKNEVVTLQYQLKGVSGHAGVARSINDGSAIGGYHVTIDQKWASQKEYAPNY